jgi:hypothetical protein
MSAAALAHARFNALTFQRFIVSFRHSLFYFRHDVLPETLLAILVAIVIAGAIFLTNLIWFRPWSLNLFYEKAFVEVIFNEPELLTSLGLAEQFGITSHNGKLNDASPAHQQAVIDRWKKDLRQLHEYPLDRQTPSQKLSTRILEWYVADQVEGEKWAISQLSGQSA